MEQPTWNDRFVYGNALTPDIRPGTAAVHRKHTQFVQSMSKFKSSSKNPTIAMSASAPYLAFHDTKGSRPTSPDQKKSPPSTPLKSAITSTSSSPLPFDSPDEPEDVEDVDAGVLFEVEDKWNNLVNKLHKIGEQIHYHDVFEVSIMREPPETVNMVLGYIALLMGLKPKWKTIRSTILKEFNIFQNFVREVIVF